jgi:hypothetical protein
MPKNGIAIICRLSGSRANSREKYFVRSPFREYGIE